MEIFACFSACWKAVRKLLCGLPQPVGDGGELTQRAESFVNIRDNAATYTTQADRPKLGWAGADVNLGFRDAPEPWQLGFQDAASPLMEEIIFFHDQIMFILTLIITVVFWVIVRALTLKFYHKYLIDGTLIEIIWTLIPAVILVFIAFPSLKLLYLMDEVIDPALTIKTIGHQ